MIKKIKALISENRDFHNAQLKQLKELEWAHIYHDSIRGCEFIETLPINIGRWAGNYPFFYVLNRILKDYQPKHILEFGMGESTKFISTYLSHILLDSKHLIIEQNTEWKDFFEKGFALPTNSEIVLGTLVNKNINGFETTHYDNIEKLVDRTYDLYVIDGPIGTERYSRYDIVNLAENFKSGDEFMIIYDDSHRQGENDTIKDLHSVLKRKKISFVQKRYQGNKTVAVIATNRYKYITSL